MKAGDAAYFCARQDADRRAASGCAATWSSPTSSASCRAGSALKAIDEGIRADYFINSEPTDLAGLTLHAGAFNWVIELTGMTRHVSKREEAVDASGGAAELVPRINGMTFSGAANDEHASVNRAHVGVLRGALSRSSTSGGRRRWRTSSAWSARAGTRRASPRDRCCSDFRRLLDDLEREHPGLRAKRVADAGRRPNMLPFEVDADVADRRRREPRLSRRCAATDQPLGPVRPYCFYGTDAAHLLHRAGMEGIVCGPGGRYNTMPDERVDIPDYLDMIKIYMLACSRSARWLEAGQPKILAGRKQCDGSFVKRRVSRGALSAGGRRRVDVPHPTHDVARPGFGAPAAGGSSRRIVQGPAHDQPDHGHLRQRVAHHDQSL